ncbi:MAG: hypothetical protein ABSF83_06720 [Nitrososphaerales archaeon]
MAATIKFQHPGDDAPAPMIVLNAALARCVVSALADEFSRRIVTSTVNEGKTVQEISLEQAVPLSTCYRRTSELSNQGLLMVERIVVTGEGKRYAIYRSSFRAVEISSNLETISASAQVNPDVAEKFNRTWLNAASGVSNEKADHSTWSS